MIKIQNFAPAALLNHANKIGKDARKEWIIVKDIIAVELDISKFACGTIELVPASKVPKTSVKCIPR